jgi:asparagine synthase (glutamine-hydrolysing)
MCGILGALRLTGEGPPLSREVLERMTATLYHRGPDNHSCLERDGLTFGFCRLSIVDLVSGDQPISNESGTVHVICNGEIFNHRELRRQLEARGHVFRTHSDVEVLVHLYEEEGDELVHSLNGQFGFAIFDETRRRLLLGRDHCGIIPVFYTVANGHFVFASEIKTLLCFPGVEREVDLTGFDQLLSLPGVISPRTLFRGIHGLPAGSLLTVERGEFAVREYWDLRFPKEHEAVYGRTPQEYQEELREALGQSVRYRLQADVPVGAYLSGGLDSSLIAGLIAANGQPVNTFSIDFTDKAFSEGKFQRLMSDGIGFPHHEIRFGSEDVLRCLSDVVWHAETPLKEAYDTACYALSAKVQDRGVRVVLSGQGADELFAGYAGYRFDAFRRAGRKRPALNPEAARLEEDLWGDPEFVYEKPQLAFREVKKRLFSERLADQYDSFDFTRQGVIARDKVAGLHVLHRRSYLDFKLRLANHLLADHGDRMALAHSVEARFPFLDIHLLDFVTRLPPDLKLHDFEDKYLLKKVAAEYVPREIIEREKFPFSAPGRPALLQSGVVWIEDLLSRERIAREGYFDADEVERLKQEYRKPGFNLNVPYEDDLLMVVLSFNLFKERFQLPSL